MTCCWLQLQKALVQEFRIESRMLTVQDKEEDDCSNVVGSFKHLQLFFLTIGRNLHECGGLHGGASDHLDPFSICIVPVALVRIACDFVCHFAYCQSFEAAPL